MFVPGRKFFQKICNGGQRIAPVVADRYSRRHFSFEDTYFLMVFLANSRGKGALRKGDFQAWEGVFLSGQDSPGEGG